VVGQGEGQRSLVGGDTRLLLVERRLLLGDLGVDIAQRRVGKIDVGLCLVELHTEIAVIDHGQYLSRRDGLVVLHQHLGDVARDLGGHDGVVGAHISVGGGVQEAAHLPVVVGEVACRSDRGGRHQPQRGALQRLARRTMQRRAQRHGRNVREQGHECPQCQPQARVR
jgi:hypothetical protein